MRLLTIALLTASGVALAAPALAQDVYMGAGPGGVGVGVDNGPYYRDRDHYRDRDVTIERRRGRTEGFAREGCRTTIITQGGVTKKIRRCY